MEDLLVQMENFIKENSKEVNHLVMAFFKSQMDYNMKEALEMEFHMAKVNKNLKTDPFMKESLKMGKKMDLEQLNGTMETLLKGSSKKIR